jgi:acetoacetate decarboxylase
VPEPPADLVAGMRGFGSPQTVRGQSVAYGPPPWRMSGRTLALWYRLADPAEARRHVPDFLELDEDPVVRVRFWDMVHDAGLGPDVPGTNPEFGEFREAVVVFPVRVSLASGELLSGDFTTYMYSDDPTYTAFGREVMGWPVRHGRIHLSRPWGETLGAGVKLTGLLERQGRGIMRTTFELTELAPATGSRAPLPTWISLKVVPAIDGPRPALRQLVRSGPERLDRGPVWLANAVLEMGDSPNDELAFLRPRSIERAEYWSAVDVTVGWGRVLAEV